MFTQNYRIMAQNEKLINSEQGALKSAQNDMRIVQIQIAEARLKLERAQDAESNLNEVLHSVSSYKSKINNSAKQHM